MDNQRIESRTMASEPTIKEISERKSVRKWITTVLHVTVPLTVYSASGFMFFPVFQSLIYHKVCLQYPSNLSHPFQVVDSSICSNRSVTSRDFVWQTKANHVLLISSVALSFSAMLAASLLGSLSDRKSRKLAMIVPFIGLIMEDISLIIQCHFLREISVYWLVLSELIFGCFGGYMSVFSTQFAFAAHLYAEDKERKSKVMALLEGCIGLGGTIGLLLTGKTLKMFGYTNVFVLFTALHIFCLCYIVSLDDFHGSNSSQEMDCDRSQQELKPLRIRFIAYFTESFKMVVKNRPNGQKYILIVLLTAFGMSYFVYMGSMHILFYYLKHQLSWDAETYGYLKGSTHACATLMALFAYPLLKRVQTSDRTLALIGLVSRLTGRLYLALVWNTTSAFALVFCDMFSRFGAAALRSLMSQQVTKFEQGKIFALVAILEGCASLLSSAIFNSLFPATLNFFPQMSYIILAFLMLIPVFCVMKIPRKPAWQETNEIHEECPLENNKIDENA